MTDKITISISEELKERLEEKLKETDFESIQDYIVYILNQIVSDGETDAESNGKQAYSEEEEADIGGDPEMLKSIQPYTEEDEETLKKNLDDMGYI